MFFSFFFYEFSTGRNKLFCILIKLKIVEKGENAIDNATLKIIISTKNYIMSIQTESRRRKSKV